MTVPTKEPFRFAARAVGTAGSGVATAANARHKGAGEPDLNPRSCVMYHAAIPWRAHLVVMSGCPCAALARFRYWLIL
jgi:hypothetical protein